MDELNLAFSTHLPNEKEWYNNNNNNNNKEND